MKPVRIPIISITFLLFSLHSAKIDAANAATNDASLLNAEACLEIPNFTANFFRSKSMREAKVSKTACIWKFVVFQGKGEKIEIDVCKPELTIYQYPSIDSTTSEPLMPGSYACPQNALFGADFSQQAGDLERFDQQRTQIFDILADGMAVHKDTKLNTFGGQLLCSKKVLKAYLENCKIFQK